MCTAITLESKDGYHFFGRNMDLEYHFNQSVLFIPRNFKVCNRLTNTVEDQGYAIMGMGTIMENHPMLADGFNEMGLAVAGLNFPGYAQYDQEIKEGFHNIPVYDFMLWMLRNFKDVESLKQQLDKVCLVEKPFMEGVPIPPLHWIVYDRLGKSIVIEQTKEQFKVFDNTVGILGNSPSFDWHLTNLNHYVGLQSKPHNENVWHNHTLKVDGQGSGLFGIPGDSYPSSRFVRAAYLKSHVVFIDTLQSTLSSFFHILDNLAFVDGTVVTEQGHQDITQYSSCICLEEKTYYYKTYTNNQLNAVRMEEDKFNDDQLLTYPYINKQSINNQNF